MKFLWNGTMLRTAVTLRNNILHPVTSSWTALITRWCYISVLCYMSVPIMHIFSTDLFFFSKLYGNIGEFPDYLQTFWPHFQMSDFFQICRYHVYGSGAVLKGSTKTEWVCRKNDTKKKDKRNYSIIMTPVT